MSFIGINFDQLQQNISKMFEQAATLPAPDAVREVNGASQEPAQSNYRNQLSDVARALGRELDKVRDFVETNAAAFQEAAASMDATEGADSIAARQADAFVQGIVAPPEPSNTPAPASPNAAPGSTGNTAW